MLEAHDYKVVALETANVRKGPSTDTDVVGILKKDQEVHIVEVSNSGWAKIKAPYTGYVLNDLLSV